jgi:Domain of unknown function (DUF4282)
MKSILNFDKFLIPHLIRIVWGFSLVIGAIVFIVGLVAMFTQGEPAAGTATLIGVPVGLVLIRIWCELIIVVFKIADNSSVIAGAHRPSDVHQMPASAAQQ